jgi:hypothetical protein
MAWMQIVEVVRRTEQGVTQPYICRAEDGFLYYVKGRGAGFPSLIKEWICGSLAKRFGLPVPDFAILEMPMALYRIGENGLLAELGHGPVFGSKEIPGSNELSMTEAACLDGGFKRDLAVFDWWIMNGDRTLSPSGGNPNILWSLPAGIPYIIDHNLAFDASTTLPTMEAGHVFGQMLTEVAASPEMQKAFAERFSACLADWNRILDQSPRRWTFLDDRQTVPAAFQPDHALAFLTRYKDGLWMRQ